MHICKLLCIILVALLYQTIPVYAHSGRTDGSGGHYCRTNCERYGLQYGEYHFKDLKITKEIEDAFNKATQKHYEQVQPVYDKVYSLETESTMSQQLQEEMNQYFQDLQAKNQAYQVELEKLTHLYHVQSQEWQRVLSNQHQSIENSMSMVNQTIAENQRLLDNPPSYFRVVHRAEETPAKTPSPSLPISKEDEDILLIPKLMICISGGVILISLLLWLVRQGKQ